VKKFAKCHHCGEKGHIRPNCPNYLKKVASGEIKCINHPRQARSPQENGTHPPRRPDKNFLKNPKAKAFLSTFQALFHDDSDDDDTTEESHSTGDELNVDNKTSTASCPWLGLL
jgi:hypothetical protein